LQWRPDLVGRRNLDVRSLTKVKSRPTASALPRTGAGKKSCAAKYPLMKIKDQSAGRWKEVLPEAIRVAGG
jgi:hypothetical protein